MATEYSISVLTFNIWALPGNFSSDKRKRIEAIGQAICDLKYDVVCLQEVWTKKDYKEIKQYISKAYPYHHYFYSGLLGSGLCTFSKWPIEECFYYRFPLNGYFHMIHHGDWCGGKGVGIVQLNIQGLIVNVYNTHLHAQYSILDSGDSYLAHRVIQAFDTALFIKLTAESADVSILAGDLNAEPTSLCMKIISCVAGLEDIYDLAAVKELKPETNDCHRNTYRDKTLETSFPGRRIDYILIKSKPTIKVNVLNHIFPLEAKIPDKNFSYSDHEAVGGCLNFQHMPAGQTSQLNDRETCQKACLENALQICGKEVQYIKRNIKKHMLIIGAILVCFPFIIISFDYKGLTCAVTTLSLCFGILMISAEYQNHSWIKNASKRIKLLGNQLKKQD